MSAIDQAFIRAYEPAASKEAPAAQSLPTVEGTSALRVDPAPSANSTAQSIQSSSFYVFADVSLQGPSAPSEPASGKIADSAEIAAVGQATLPTTEASKAGAATLDGPRLHIEEPPAAPVGDPAKQRRPLSEFIKSESVDAKFRPALEVDRFAWSSAVEELADGGLPVWQQTVETLIEARAQGRTLVGVAGAEQQSGCTSTLACLALMLARQGLKVALVDGNFHRPGLAQQLGVAPEIGWEDVLAGRLPLAEAAIHSIADDTLLLPLTQGGAPAAEKLDGVHASVTAGVLRYNYDVALFDLGAIASRAQNETSRRIVRNCRLDAAILTLRELDADWTVCERLAHVNPELAEICLGVVQRNARSL